MGEWGIHQPRGSGQPLSSQRVGRALRPRGTWAGTSSSQRYGAHGEADAQLPGRAPPGPTAGCTKGGEQELWEGPGEKQR